MIKRTLSTIALWSVVFGTVYFFKETGGVILLAIFTVLAQYEFQGLLEKSGLPPYKYFPLVFGFLMVLAAGGLLADKFAELLFPAGILALALGTLACAKSPQAINRLAGSVLAIVYVPLMMMFYALLATDRNIGGIGMAIWVIAVAKFTDVGGYLVGSLIGRHKLAPSISPGKTWEGVVGGLALAMIVGYGIGALAPHFLVWWFTPWLALILPLPIGVSAIVSDLSESAFKRRAGMKDSGRCIPGIGGALDLADSLLFAGPIAFFLINYFMPQI